MKLLILALVCFGASSVYGLKGGFRVRWGMTNFGREHFIDLPKTSPEALAAGWTFERRADADVLRFLVLWCHPTHVLCVLYDDTGYAAGLQVAIPVDEFTQPAFDMIVQGFIPWNPSNGRTYWAIQQYFIDDAFLAIPSEVRLANRDPEKFLQAGGIWVRGNNREILRIGDTLEQINSVGFTEQGCVPFMGLHHYMRMTPNMPCTSEAMYPFFPLTQNGELMGAGLAMFGSLPFREDEFFERPSREGAQMTAPYGPECVPNLAVNPGMVTIHTYYIDEPWTVFCN